jgi:hypothetical protein
MVELWRTQEGCDVLNWNPPKDAGVTDSELPWSSEILLEGHWRPYNPGHKSDIYVDRKNLKDIFTKLVLSLWLIIIGLIIFLMQIIGLILVRITTGKCVA